jgi:hypothetical protein
LEQQKKEIENQIAAQVVVLASKYAWKEARLWIEIEGKGFTRSIALFDESNIEIRYGLNGFDKEPEAVLNKLVKNLVVNYQDPAWNKTEFIIHLDGSYTSNFTWDKDKELNDIYMGAEASINWLYDRFTEYVALVLTNHWQEEEKNWEESTFTITKTGKFFRIEGYVIWQGKRRELAYEPADPAFRPERVSSEYLQELLTHLDADTNEGVLKGRWPKWNQIVFHLTHYQMNFEKDIIFQWREENL